MLMQQQGFIHPLVQLGLGIEFNQPAIVAEGLAQAAVHSDHYLFAFFHEAEERAPGVASKYLAGLLDLASADEKCRNASNSQVREKVRDGVLLNVREEAINLAAQYQVGEDEVDLRLAEPSNASGTAFTPLSNKPKLTIIYQRTWLLRPRGGTRLHVWTSSCFMH
jgi:hypothetical protein